MSKVRVERRAMVAGNSTREEIIREAEHVFQQPTPLIKAMLDLLRGDRVDVRHPAKQCTAEPVTGVHCPACGAVLQFDEENN